MLCSLGWWMFELLWTFVTTNLFLLLLFLFLLPPVSFVTLGFSIPIGNCGCVSRMTYSKCHPPVRSTGCRIVVVGTFGTALLVSRGRCGQIFSIILLILVITTVVVIMMIGTIFDSSSTAVSIPLYSSDWCLMMNDVLQCTFQIPYGIARHLMVIAMSTRLILTRPFHVGRRQLLVACSQ